MTFVNQHVMQPRRLSTFGYFNFVKRQCIFEDSKNCLFSTPQKRTIHKYKVKRPKKDMKFAAGFSRKPRMSVMVGEEDAELDEEMLVDEGVVRGDKQTLEDIPACDEAPILASLLKAVRQRKVVEDSDLTPFVAWANDGKILEMLDEQRVLEVLDCLISFGFSGTSLLNVLTFNGSSVFRLNQNRIMNVFDQLRERGFISTQIVDLVSSNPSILLDFSAEEWDKRQAWFYQYFATRTFRELLPQHPNLLTDTLDDIEDRYFYVYSKMGLDQKQMLECRLFSHSLMHIRVRHTFVERCGVYKFPDPKGRVVNVNPHLKLILDSSDRRFLQLVPGAVLGDFRVFKLMMEEEIDEEVDEEESEDEEEKLRLAGIAQWLSMPQAFSGTKKSTRSRGPNRPLNQINLK